MPNDIEYGDLYDPSASSADVLDSMKALVAAAHAGTRVALTSRVAIGSWRIVAAILDHPQDLADREVSRTIKRAIARTIARYGYYGDIPEADHRRRLFDTTVAVHEDYWSKRQLDANPGFRITSYNQVAGRAAASGSLRDESSGRSYRVAKANAKGIILTDGTAGFTIMPPRRAALSTSGDLVRFARGTEAAPDEHSIYRMMP